MAQEAGSVAAASYNPPGRVFIIRHGERLDHVHRAWPRAHGCDRVHDSPLTDAGIVQGRLAAAHILATAPEFLNDLHRLDATTGESHATPPPVLAAEDAAFVAAACALRASDGPGREAALTALLASRHGPAHYAVLTSPLRRCVATAGAIAESLGVTVVRVEESLIEESSYMAGCCAVDAAVVPDNVVRATHRARQIVPRHGVRLPLAELQKLVPPSVTLVEHAPLVPPLGLQFSSQTGQISSARLGRYVSVEELAAEGWSALLAECVSSAPPVLAARPLPMLPALDGLARTVVMCGHGDSIHAWFNATQAPARKREFPYPFDFNCCSELRVARGLSRRALHEACASMVSRGAAASHGLVPFPGKPVSDGEEAVAAADAAGRRGAPQLYELNGGYFSTPHLAPAAAAALQRLAGPRASPPP